MAAYANTATQNIISFVAGGAITANRAVILHSTEGQVVASSAITDVVIGVALSTVASGEQVDVQVGGIAKVGTTAASVSLGAQVMPGASGSGLCLTAAGATAKSFGIALTAGGGTAGELISVLLATPNVNGPANS